MNNKGQSLVTFILFLPILLLILYMVYVIGRMSTIRSNLDGINYLAINYGLDIMDDENAKDKVEEFIAKNDGSIDNVNVNYDDNKLYIILSTRYDGNKLLKNMDFMMIRSSYVGYIENDIKIVKENR